MGSRSDRTFRADASETGELRHAATARFWYVGREHADESQKLYDWELRAYH